MKIGKIVVLISVTVAIIVGIYFSLSSSSFKFPEYELVIYKGTYCSCCEGYINYLRENGFRVMVIETNEFNLNEVKKSLNIPEALYACHTVLLNKIGSNSKKPIYFVEGHVPVEAIQKLLTEKPDIDGIALPGMPSGSPGMSGVKISPFKVYSIKNGENIGIFMEI